MTKVLGDYFTLQRGNTYKSALLGMPGPVLLGLGSIARNGGFKGDNLKTYGGPSDPRMLLGPGDMYVSLKDVTQSADLLGAVARVPARIEQGRLTQDTVKLVFKSEDAPKDYLYWLLQTVEYRAYCRAHSTGTTNLGLARDDFLGFPVPELTPSRSRIVRLLQEMDDKIELNRRMNETLEAMAQAIFRDWFVDFGPVHRKLAGATDPVEIMGGVTTDPLHATELSGLFPSALNNGELPDGFEFITLGDVVAVLETGTRPKGGIKGIDAGVPSIGAESIVGLAKFDFSKTKYVPVDFFASMRRGVIGERDVLLYKDGGRPGEFEPHVAMFGAGFPFSQCCINEHVYRLVAAVPFSQEFLYLHLTSEGSMDEMRNKGTGVAIPGLNSTAANSLSILNPGAELLAAFTRTVRPLVDAALHGASESRTLAETRDYLLPRLMSGEVRVLEAEHENTPALAEAC